jgi:hypothetical protein
MELAQITSTYATPFDRDKGLIFTWFWSWYVDYSDVALPKELGCFHSGGVLVVSRGRSV